MFYLNYIQCRYSRKLHRPVEGVVIICIPFLLQRLVLQHWPVSRILAPSCLFDFPCIPPK
jgi:hypothetical protein